MHLLGHAEQFTPHRAVQSGDGDGAAAEVAGRLGPWSLARSLAGAGAVVPDRDRR